MDSPGYQSEIENELSSDECLKIIDDFYHWIRAWGIQGRINFTGGDPLLKNGVFELIKYAHDKGITVGILGNPEPLNHEVVSRLRTSGVTSYQVSIDGMEKTHDKFRRKGSFKRTLEAIKLLNQGGIRSVVMSTVSKQNVEDLIPLINLVAKEKVTVFDFARLVPIGKGVQFKEELIKPEEYRNLLLDVLEEYRRLEKEGCQTFFGRKDHLWTLLYKELGLLPPLSEDKKTIFRGCAIGINLLVVVADGIVYPCRRLPLKIGKAPEQSLRDVFINSSELNEMRQLEKFKKCSKCDLFQYCRGCPAVAYGATGDYFAPDPQCWS
jgi:radical SAM/SPASM domain protein of ACGX system